MYPPCYVDKPRLVEIMIFITINDAFIVELAHSEYGICMKNY